MAQSNTISKVEDLIAWQKARVLCVTVFKLMKENKFLQQDNVLKDQLKRAVLSVVLNIAEGYGRQGNREFVNFLSISRGSLLETKTLLIIANDLNYISSDELERLKETCAELERIIGGLSSYLNKTEYKGVKYKSELKEEVVVYNTEPYNSEL